LSSCNVFPAVYCLYHSRTLHPFDVTEPAQSLCSDEVYYVLMFYYFIRLLISFYSSYSVFIFWAEYFPKDSPFKYQWFINYDFFYYPCLA
jgi:hypothetical protein